MVQRIANYIKLMRACIRGNLKNNIELPISDIEETNSSEDTQEDEDGYVSKIDDEVVLFVEDEYDPCRINDPAFRGSRKEDDVNYLNMVFLNGNMYVQQPQGQITLKQWKFFVDEQQLKDFIKNYAIQSHYEFITERSNNTIYSVVCSGLTVAGSCGLVYFLMALFGI